MDNMDKNNNPNVTVNMKWVYQKDYHVGDRRKHRCDYISISQPKKHENVKLYIDTQTRLYLWGYPTKEFFTKITQSHLSIGVTVKKKTIDDASSNYCHGDIVYSKQFMHPILDCFVNTRILSVYENIDSSICQKIISSRTS